MLAWIWRKHARPPLQKGEFLPDDVGAKLATPHLNVRVKRVRALQLLHHTGRLRRLEIVCFKVSADDTPNSGNWTEILEDSALLTLDDKTGRRAVEVARGS